MTKGMAKITYLWRGWPTELLPTDFTDPATGEPLYVYHKIAPRWYWRLRRLQLFLGILWRHWETHRLSWSTAWMIAKGVYEDELPGGQP